MSNSYLYSSIVYYILYIILYTVYNIQYFKIHPVTVKTGHKDLNRSQEPGRSRILGCIGKLKVNFDYF